MARKKVSPKRCTRPGGCITLPRPPSATAEDSDDLGSTLKGAVSALRTTIASPSPDDKADSPQLLLTDGYGYSLGNLLPASDLATAAESDASAEHNLASRPSCEMASHRASQSLSYISSSHHHHHLSAEHLVPPRPLWQMVPALTPGLAGAAHSTLLSAASLLGDSALPPLRSLPSATAGHRQGQRSPEVLSSQQHQYQNWASQGHRQFAPAPSGTSRRPHLGGWERAPATREAKEDVLTDEDEGDEEFYDCNEGAGQEPPHPKPADPKPGESLTRGDRQRRPAVIPARLRDHETTEGGGRKKAPAKGEGGSRGPSTKGISPPVATPLAPESPKDGGSSFRRAPAARLHPKQVKIRSFSLQRGTPLPVICSLVPQAPLWIPLPGCKASEAAAAGGTQASEERGGQRQQARKEAEGRLLKHAVSTSCAQPSLRVLP